MRIVPVRGYGREVGSRVGRGVSFTANIAFSPRWRVGLRNPLAALFSGIAFGPSAAVVAQSSFPRGRLYCWDHSGIVAGLLIALTYHFRGDVVDSAIGGTVRPPAAPAGVRR
jgi:hypothetical protein